MTFILFDIKKIAVSFSVRMFLNGRDFTQFSATFYSQGRDAYTVIEITRSTVKITTHIYIQTYTHA